MKNIYEVLRQKEADLARVQGEVDALRLVISLLIEDEEEVPTPEVRIGPESASPPDKSAAGSSHAAAV